ncbi:(Fe-S)-binding protein [Polluticoccus soli]|uniref:(Fe-S)-binding protein n=1 Tax=Polluticoccus soli TaxID=3034150 RepID=UPI0023E0D0C1|nr:(Fe-S)-binding protein [Flavipsychrobacter sp. JY13-12]
MHNVQLFIPCFVDQLYPQTGINMVKVLEKLGCNVTYNANQTCCGQPAFNAGFWDDAKGVARKFLTDFEGEGYIVGPSGSCTGFVRNYYDKMFENSAEHNHSGKVGKRMYEFTEFLIDVLKVEDLGATLQGKATYHDACGALRECGIKQAPRKLLDKVKGLELTEMKECETCCGFGGTFAVKFEPISVGMAQTKVQSALDTGAQYMISTDVSCLMHLQGYIDKNNLPMQTMHIADVLASGW